VKVFQVKDRWILVPGDKVQNSARILSAILGRSAQMMAETPDFSVRAMYSLRETPRPDEDRRGLE
jgi:hypothetical protein